MKKVAIFVEGQTESIFTEKLVEEIFKSLNFEITSINHGDKVSIKKAIDPVDPQVSYFFMIYDCNGEGGVKSRIKSNLESLQNADYQLVLGLRDLFPLKPQDFEPLISNSLVGLEAAQIEIKIVVAVEEVETWFIQQEAHFLNISPNLTAADIERELGFNPAEHDARIVQNPAKLLDKIYRLVGLQYDKKEYQVTAMMDYLDFDVLYVEDRAKNADLNLYITKIESIFSD